MGDSSHRPGILFSGTYKLAKALLALITSPSVTDPVVKDLQRDLKQDYQLVELHLNMHNRLLLGSQ